MCLIVGLKIKMRSFVWYLWTKIFRSDQDYSNGSPVCCSVCTQDLAGQCFLFKTTLKSHSDRIVLYLLVLLATAKNNWMTVKEDAFLSLYILPHPGFVYFLHLTAVFVFSVAVFSLYCQSACFCSIKKTLSPSRGEVMSRASVVTVAALNILKCI